MLKRKMKPMNLILASGSPRRRELLSLYTTDFTVCASDFDESAVTADTPAQLVENWPGASALPSRRSTRAPWCSAVIPWWT